MISLFALYGCKSEVFEWDPNGHLKNRMWDDLDIAKKG